MFFSHLSLIAITCFTLGLDYCNVRCDVDAQCGGDCKRCATTSDNDRVCQGFSACGGQCKMDSECDGRCDRCVDGVCSGLPCGADCGNSAWCDAECSACLPGAIDSNRTVCTRACGVACLTSGDCAEPCPHCGFGVCGTDAALSAGAVAGIAIATALVGGGVLFPIVVALIAGYVRPSLGLGVLCVGLISIPFGIALFGLAFGLSLGLSTSICCE